MTEPIEVVVRAGTRAGRPGHEGLRDMAANALLELKNIKAIRGMLDRLVELDDEADMGQGLYQLAIWEQGARSIIAEVDSALGKLESMGYRTFTN
jgi:hypothetical protein